MSRFDHYFQMNVGDVIEYTLEKATEIPWDRDSMDFHTGERTYHLRGSVLCSAGSEGCCAGTCAYCSLCI